VSHLIGQWLLERLGQPFDIENHLGAGTNIATEAAVGAPAEGYTPHLLPNAWGGREATARGRASGVTPRLSKILGIPDIA
jgi:tripartite-type tricarboxylate transporter receptor subunit TctC